MIKKYDMILAAEEAFARQVALGVIVTSPLTVWHTIIPFMFIFDFVKRGKIIRSYTLHFIFPRKLAIDAAQDIIEGEDRKERLLRVEKDIKAWLNALDLYSQALHDTELEVVHFLVDHYTKLLQANGDTYNDLVRNVYVNRHSYTAHLAQLTSLEKEVDRALEKLRKIGKLREKILAEQQQLEKMRQKRVKQIF